MPDWSEGYVSDINYTYGYSSELNPNNIVIPFLMAGIKPPLVTQACELGFGQGVSLNIHAAASAVQWYATDFNPAQVLFAKDMASVSGHDAQIFDESFREFSEREDLPEFDFISLHGIWAWVSADNQRLIVDFIRRKLKVGGVVYISYNTLPGWTTMSALQHMLSEYDQVMGSRKASKVERIHHAFGFTQALIDQSPSLIDQSPSLPKCVQNHSKKNAAYLVHEYLNRDWQALYFSQVADALLPAKLTYVCAANFLEDYQPSNLTLEQQAILADLHDPIFMQSSKDYMQNKFFRRDLWVKGARELSSHELNQYWQSLRFMLIINADEVKFEVTGAAGKVELQRRIYEPIIEALSDYQSHNVLSIRSQLSDDFSVNLLYEALAVLQASGVIALVQDEAIVHGAKERCNRLNSYIMQQNMAGKPIGFLASPLTGGGLHIDKISMMFLFAYTQGVKGTLGVNKLQTGEDTRALDEWVVATWQQLQSLDQCLIKEGKTLYGEAENLAELRRLAQRFSEGILRIAQRLQIVE